MSTISSSATRRRVIGQNFFWNFWVKRVFLFRMVPIIVLTFLTYNAFAWSFWVWASATVQGLQMSTDDSNMSDLVGLLLVGAIVMAIWYYVLSKAWQGFGGKVYKVAIPVVIVGLFLYFLVVNDVMPTAGPGFISILEFAFGMLVGLGFSATIIDRRMSGTATSAVIIQEDDAGIDDGHHHD